MRFPVAAAISLAILVSSAKAQTAPAGDSQSPTFKAGGEEVVVDVVVRDKKGHLIKDLKSDNFRVLDNGQQRPIKTFRLVEGREAVSSSGARTQLDPLRQIRLVTLIYQRLLQRCERSPISKGCSNRPDQVRACPERLHRRHDHRSPVGSHPDVYQ